MLAYASVGHTHKHTHNITNQKTKHKASQVAHWSLRFLLCAELKQSYAGLYGLAAVALPTDEAPPHGPQQ